MLIRRLSSLILAFVLAALLSGVPVQTAQAHCPGGTGKAVPAGGLSLDSTRAKGVFAEITWTQPEVCNSGVSHSVTIGNNGQNVGFLQVGWRYYAGWPQPMAYCEFRSLGYMGFSTGSWLVAQGESHAPHVQIGRMVPNELEFREMQYRKVDSATWSVMNILPNSPPWPYYNDEPASGEFRV